MIAFKFIKQTKNTFFLDHQTPTKKSKIIK